MKTTKKPAIGTTNRPKVRQLSAADLRLAVGGECPVLPITLSDDSRKPAGTG
jgi:hypothetical protein